MIFVYRKWNNFCKQLRTNNLKSVTAKSINSTTGDFLVLKHDVETNVKCAYKLAKIENKYEHKGSYYVQAYLMTKKNIKLLNKMKDMGHEISYHHDVMDSNKGDLSKAKVEFEKNRMNFVNNGFDIETVCQHGNPIIERIGYTSNRDFFRSKEVKDCYPNITDIMVNFKDEKKIEYAYYSDAGRKFKLIFDPINNDVIKSDDKDIHYKNLKELLNAVKLNKCCIISTHPHRWTNSSFIYIVKLLIFKISKMLVKGLIKIPAVKKIANKYYYLAKKI